jgi:4-diphosphocytidyl-2-C-methyl-D-erythritol kinase
MNVHRLASHVFVHAPAKLNLFFEILGKRGDGFHEVETLMAPISLCDTLIARPRTDRSVTLVSRWAVPRGQSIPGDLPADVEQNLVVRAVRLLQQQAPANAGLDLQLIKRIPSAAGLGGGSSDAAAALLAANAAWQLGLGRDHLAELAAQLGSDVPFFLGRGAALCLGRGERIEPLARPVRLHAVVVRPPEGLPTAAVYGRSLVPETPRRAAPLVGALASGDQRALARQLYNRLQPAAESLSPWIARIASHVAAEDCLAAQMSGSGSAYFGICRHARHARRVARRLQSRDIGRVYAVSTSN